MNHTTSSTDPAACRACWLRITQRQVVVDAHGEHEGEWVQQLVAAGVCGGLGIAGWALGDGTGQLLCNVGAYVAGGWFAVEETWERLQEWEIDVHFLMLAVACGAALIGQWSEGVVLLFLFSFASALEHFAQDRTQREIRSLMRSAPKTATIVLANGEERLVPVEELVEGQKVRLKPGESFPVDGEVIEGETEADESSLTGEAIPVEKKRGDQVMAGTLNLWGAIDLRVSRVAAESALQKIIRLIEDAQRQQAPTQRMMDRWSGTYVIGVLCVAVALFFGWWLVGGASPFVNTPEGESAFYRAMTLLVVASPCALVLSIPSAVLAAIAAGARRGVLFRGGSAVEQLAEVEVVAMDKTGTLTTGEMRLERVESFPKGKEEDVLRWAYGLEKQSTHPLARAVTRHGRREKVKEVVVEEFCSVAGMGLEGRIEGETVKAGRRNWVVENVSEKLLEGLVLEEAEEGVSEVWIKRGDVLGRLVLRDDIRIESKDVVLALHERGLVTMVLTGDREKAARYLQEALEVSDVRAELHPQDKLGVILDFVERGVPVAMVGDGINDAPSLAAAHVGVAMGARGADAALEQADVVLMHDKLENFLMAYDLSVRARGIIRQNVAIAAGVMVVLFVCALVGRIPLPVGVMGHEGSTVIVVLNSLRLLIASGGENGGKKQSKNEKTG